ncbi:MAG: Gfo/Idh/MocA family oxidoreductase [Pseudomonadota bacterium]|nr:Gfo/Idh/MocA family oxidoreductase [Pseudomonadota bacterium]
MTLKVVVIGTGFGARTVAPSYRDAGAEVVLVSPRDPSAVARAIQAPCDLVSVHSPPFLHHDHVAMAVALGRHVLCDKPFGRNGEEAADMLRLAQQAGVQHFLNFEFRCEPVRERVRLLLAEGAIGEPVHLNYSMYLARGREMPHGWLFEQAQGGGWIGAFASHVVDMLHWWFGAIDTVSCQTRIDMSQRHSRDPADLQLYSASAEDALTAVFRMENGVTAALDTAFSATQNHSVG